METNIQKRNIESTFTAKKTNFTIEASAKAFQILSSNLYTDKPLAIVRELSANALDAHKQAKEERPFLLTLPSRMNPSFEIRDYGIGMSPDTIQELYTTFFGSNKNHDNEAIGGLGLGSKTPFSYTDTFTLLSFWEGIKYTWLCMIQEDGQPSISMVEQSKSDEPRGIQYVIPVKQEDFYTFSNKARDVLSYFPEGSFKAPDIEVSDIAYSLRRKEYGMRTNTANAPKVVMGPIAYRLDKSALASDIQTKFYKLLNNTRLDIFCGIGDIDIQASREALSYDKRSQQQIITVLQRVTDRIAKDTTEEIAACKTFLDACLKGAELSSQASIDFDTLRWKKRELVRSFDYQREASICKVSGRFSLTKSDALSISFTRYTIISVQDAVDSTVVFYDPTVKFNKVKMKTLLLQDRAKEYILFSKMDELEAFQKEAGTKGFITTESLPMPDKDDVTYKTVSRSKVQLKQRTDNSAWGNLSSSFDEINEFKNTCWAPLSGGGTEPWDDEKDRKAYELLATFEGVNMVGVPKSLRRKQKLITLPTLQEHCRARMIQIIKTEERYNAAFLHRSGISWLSAFQTSVDKKKWLELDIVIEANLHVQTATLNRHKSAIEDLFGWKLKPMTGKQIEARDIKVGKGYKLLGHVDNLYGYRTNKSEYLDDILTLINRRK